MSEQQPINVIYGCEGSDEESFFNVRSPQVPGLTGGDTSLKDLVASVPGLLGFAGVDVLDAAVRRHVEWVVEAGGAEIAIRKAEDGHARDRDEVAERLIQVLRDPEQRQEILEAPVTRTGEIVFVCAVPTDTIRWVVDQLDPAGDVVGVVLSVAEGLVWFSYIGVGEGMRRGAPPAAFGLELDSTLGELMRARATDRPAPRLLVAA